MNINAIKQLRVEINQNRDVLLIRLIRLSQFPRFVNNSLERIR
jgi:hypothetical protein